MSNAPAPAMGLRWVQFLLVYETGSLALIVPGLNSSLLWNLSAALGVAASVVGCGDTGDGQEATEGRSETGALLPEGDPVLVEASESGVWVIELRSAPELPRRGNNDLWLTVTSEEDGSPALDLELTMTPFMPLMGHGSGQEPRATAVELGVYRFQDVHLTMPGLWELRTNIGGVVDDAVVLSVEVR